MKEMQRVCGPATVTGAHRELWGQEAVIPARGCLLPVGWGLHAAWEDRRPGIHSFFIQSSIHPPIHPSIHPPATSYPSFRPPPSIRSFIHSFSTLHPSILLEMLLSTYCAQTLRQAASRMSEALSDMAWCWNKDSMTEHVLCVQPHLTPRRPCVADATSMPTSQMRKLRLR